VDAWIEVREGARAGSVHRLKGEPVVVGRHDDVQLRLDPHADLAVSGRHALLQPTPGGWAIRDLGSTNGTWVNDEVIEGDRVLADRDRIRLGRDGPLLVFRLAQSQPDTLRLQAGIPARRRARRAAWTAAVVAAVALSAVTYLAGRATMRRDLERERAALEARMDSVLADAQTRTAEMQARADSLSRHSDADVHSLQARVSGLLEALQTSEGQVRSLRTSLREARSDGLDDDEITSLRQRLQSVTVDLQRQQLAASLDFAAIERVTRDGTAQVYVSSAEGVVTGTAFGVSPSGVVMTNRHVVQGSDGTVRPDRIGVQFADSRQVWPAHIVAVSETSDLALLQVERLEGTIPTVLGFNTRLDTLASGSPVAMLGFPLGGLPPQGSAGVVRPLLTAGVISGRRGDLLELRGYGEKGASGSPVLDRDGRVVGILVGGTEVEGEHTLLAVPASEAVRLIGRG
jgi:S1-C subfamily serine protease